MPTTTNFGWTTPADTDLVKDGAAAIRTLGTGIDTSFVKLKGGTTGQILSKTSNTDLDYTWINNDQGDITAVTTGATSGLTGGATSGAVDLKFNTTAKGGLLIGTGAGTVSELTVGANNTVLTADSTTATGLKWATPAGAYTQIATGSLSTGTTSISSIPTTYRDLRLVVYNISHSTAAGADLFVRFNNISTSSYYNTFNRVTTAGGGAADYGYLTGFRLNQPGASALVGNAYGVDTNMIVDIWEYASTNFYKRAQMLGHYYAVTNNTYQFQSNDCLLNGERTNAITSLQIVLSTGTFSTGTYVLYGVL